jgi:type II secretory pathway pseudopilin PulG
MFRRIIVILILSLLIASCGAAAPSVVTEAPASEESAATEAPVNAIIAEAIATSAPLPTSTPQPTFTPSITPTETPLPPLDLPTEAANAPAKMAWDGVPTYPGDSTPGFSFRVTYDPDVWAVTADPFGFPALGHRAIDYCVIAVTTGRGLPANVTVEHDVLYTDTVTFDVGSATENGIKKFVTYTGGDGRIITAFEVSFQAQSESCLADAVTVLSTLTSVPVSQATPAP